LPVPRADDDVQARLRAYVEAVEETFLDLNPLNDHLVSIDQAFSQVDPLALTFSQFLQNSFDHLDVRPCRVV